MTGSVEDRLRTHFADLAELEPRLPEPDPGPIMAGEVPRLADDTPVSPASRRPRSRRMVVAAGLVAAVLVVAAVVVAGGLARHRGRVDIRPATTVPPTQPPPTAPPTSAPATTVRGTGGTTVPARPPGTDSAVTPAGSSLAVADGGVLGFWDGRAWHDAPAGTTVPVQGGETYQVVHLGDPITRLTGGAPTPACDPALRQVGIPFPGDPRIAGVAVTGVADPRPRPVAVLDPAATGYEAAAQQVLAGLGVPDARPVVVQAVRADLDGDGTDEAVVVVQRAADQSTAGGPDDYSVVFVRRVVAGQVVTKVVAHSVGGASVGGSQPTAELYSVDALADLNGDGRMEIVVGNRGWEWGGSTAFELRPDGSVAQVLQTGCGV